MKANEAPLFVPVEIQAAEGGPEAPRWLRLSVAISEQGLRLRSPLPAELCDRPLSARLHLPIGQDPPYPEVVLHGLAAHVVVDEGGENERSELRGIEVRRISEESRARIERYVALRLDSA